MPLDVGACVIPVAGVLWISLFMGLFLIPERRMALDMQDAFKRSLEAIRHELSISRGHEKRNALMVPESKWEGVDVWLNAWRGKPWPAKYKTGDL